MMHSNIPFQNFSTILLIFHHRLKAWINGLNKSTSRRNIVIIGPKSMIQALEVSTLRRFGGSHWLLFSQLSQLPDSLKPSWVGDLESGIV